MSRPTSFTSPLGDKLLFRGMRGTERLGRLFEYTVDLLSTDEGILFDDIVGHPVSIKMETEKEGERFFHGYVTRFSYTGASGRYSAYRATMRPWLWFLSQTADCQIFQEMTVPDIIEKIFEEAGFSDYELKLSGHYRFWDYNVQYRETDFNFISRLMEQEGIYYYFKHEADKHTLVLADSVGAHETIPNYDSIPYFERNAGAAIRKRDHVYRWLPTHDIQTGSYALRGFDFIKPKAAVEGAAESLTSQTKPTDSDQVYDYPGEYTGPTDGQNYAEQRIKELECKIERVNGSGSARGICSGYLFTLTNFPRPDQNDKEYLVVGVTHEIHSDAYESQGFVDDDELYSCQFEVIDSETDYRSERVTPKPMVHGPQTAIVVGPGGEEIYVDEYARVKVHFHWDRHDGQDENSSCWIRISNDWSGKKWGQIQIPRIGQEVIVSFLEGDPDRPIITGRVYNADNMPPYDLPANKTQSGIKSRSTPDGSGSNFNEIRMEDKKGSEELYIHAEKDENIIVENDKTEDVGHDETIEIGNDRKEKVGNDETIEVVNDRKEQVGRDEEWSVGRDSKRSVGRNDELSVGKSRDHSVGENETISVTDNQESNIGKDQNVGVGDNRGLVVGKDLSVNTGANESRDVGKNLNITVGKAVTITCGPTTISLNSKGDVKIDGKKMVLNGKTITIKASGNLVLKGSKILMN